MKLVIDTSVVIKWFVDEDDFETARLLIEPRFERVAPELVIAEAANVLQRKMRSGQLTTEQATDAVQKLQYFFDELIPSTSLIQKGFALSKLLDHSVYDCIFLASALMNDDCRLVTSDMKFADKAIAAGCGERIWTLEVARNALVAGQEHDNG